MPLRPRTRTPNARLLSGHRDRRRAKLVPRLGLLICRGSNGAADSNDPLSACSIPVQGLCIEDYIRCAEDYVWGRSVSAANAKLSDCIPMGVELWDEDGRLVLCGLVLGRVIDWCCPVLSPAEIKQVQARHTRLNNELLYLTGQCQPDTGTPVLARLRCHEYALRGKLVNPIWRERSAQALERLGLRRLRAQRSFEPPSPMPADPLVGDIPGSQNLQGCDTV